jgi:hypothetical protein
VKEFRINSDTEFLIFSVMNTGGLSKVKVNFLKNEEMHEVD